MNHTISSLRESLSNKETSPSEIFDLYKKKITQRNPEINAFLSQRDRPDHKDFDPTQPLSGIPFALKDNMLVEGEVATGASKILENYISSYTATAVKEVMDNGGNLLGKTNLDEFAMGTTTENSAYGPTKNPLDTTRVPGGSSGGSAAAVADDQCVFALGSDTGGSIRQPAALCGVVGFKPSYGRVSRHGLMAMASSLDQIGPITKNVRDAALVAEIISGHDIFDSTTIEDENLSLTPVLDQDARGLVAGVPKEFFMDGLSDEVRKSVEGTIKKMEGMGFKIEEISLPNFEFGLAAYYIINPCEISANLSRLDGIRYGLSRSGDTLLDRYLQSRSEGFGPEVKRRIMLGAYALSSGYYDAYYLKAQKVRALIKKDFDDAFKKVDIIVGPTAPNTAFKIGEKVSDPLSLYLEDVYTVAVNLIGAPAISIPCGKGELSGMPVGFHIIGKNFDEKTVLRSAHNIEQELAK